MIQQQRQMQTSSGSKQKPRINVVRILGVKTPNGKEPAEACDEILDEEDPEIRNREGEGLPEVDDEEYEEGLWRRRPRRR